MIGNTFGPAQLALRRRSIGASDAPGVLGISPWEDDTPLSKWLDKLGRRPAIVPNQAMQWGTLLEPVILGIYEQKTGLRVDMRQCLGRHPEIQYMTATLDGICDGRIVEVKNVGADSPGWTDLDVPDNYMVQVQHQLAVFDMQEADLVVLRGGQEFNVYPIRRNDDMIDAIIRVERQFWECVQSGTPPNWGRIDAKTLAILNPECYGEILLDEKFDDALFEWELLREQKKEYEKREKEITALILEAMGTGSIGQFPSGRRIKRYLTQVAESTSVRQAHTRHFFQVVKDKK